MQTLRQFIFDHVPPVLIDLLGQCNKIIYRGTAYQCPLCMSNLASFLPLPGQFRITLEIKGRSFTAPDFETLNVDNYLCPVCRCSDRDRLIALYLNRLTNELAAGKRLLHFAPERSLSKYLRHTAPYDYRTADLKMKNVDEKVDITRMATYNDNSLDCFICSHILEHVPDDTQAMRELFRILKPGGWGIVMTPILPGLDTSYEDFSKTAPEERLEHFGQRDHVRVYAKGDFIRRLENAGFAVMQVGVDFFGADSMRRSGVNEKSCLYVLMKGTSNHYSAMRGSGVAR
jgi:hypothetical protein